MVEGARLESVYTSKAYRGFESLLLRHLPPALVSGFRGAAQRAEKRRGFAVQSVTVASFQWAVSEQRGTWRWALPAGTDAAQISSPSAKPIPTFKLIAGDHLLGGETHYLWRADGLCSHPQASTRLKSAPDFTFCLRIQIHRTAHT